MSTSYDDHYEDDDQLRWVTCPECGNMQTDMGVNVACDECGHGPLPSFSYPDNHDLHPDNDDDE